MSQFSLLKKKSFASFFVTQMFGAMTDNLFKQTVIMLITFQLALDNGAIWVNAAAGIFILPFFLFSGLGGQLSTKYPKATVIKFLKMAELGIMAMGVVGLHFQNLMILLVTLFLMGLQSAIFGPAKYSILPEQIEEGELVGGNALVETGTFLAILLGTILGSYLIVMDGGAFYVSTAILSFSAIGVLASWGIKSIPPSCRDLSINLNPILSTKNLFDALRKESKSVFHSIIAISWFWLVGATILSQLPTLAASIGGDETTIAVMLTMFSIGIAAGSLTCEKISFGRVEIGLVPIGSFGLSIGVLLFANRAETLVVVGGGIDILAAAMLVATGFFGGIFTVPLYALLQSRVKSENLPSIIAANNMLNAMFMVASAIAAAILIAVLQFSPMEILYTVAIFNLIATVIIYKKVPEFAIRLIAYLLSNTMYRVKKSGYSNIPDTGACIIAPNHVSFVDAILLFGTLHRPLKFVMYEPIYRIPVLNWFFRQIGAIPIASIKENRKVFNTAFASIDAALKRGEVVCIFPEGKLTADGEVDAFKSGIFHIVKKTPCPVIPTYIDGLWGSMFSRKNKVRLPRLKWSKIKINFGESVVLEDLDKHSLREKVISLRDNC